MKSVATKAVYLTQEEFDRDLEICLLIINEPSRQRPYYVCEYTSASLYKSIVHIYLKK
jgi:hypothetical protein